MTFLFVLLIILVVKTPRLGAWLVGSLVLPAPLVLWWLATTGAFRHDEGVIIPLVVVPVTFLFVLMVIVLAKAPKAGAGLIVALVAMGVLGLFFVGTRHVSHAPTSEDTRRRKPHVRRSDSNGLEILRPVKPSCRNSTEYSKATCRNLPALPSLPLRRSRPGR